ncbi:Olfactory receptor 7G2 [Sciurus carolinensis]|uniref:Olfactory receptor 7G2 n=1 Tax=Sciurus carolinensis TaxID=30640 RepID=A0AA41SZA2_SCICA|nr:Olfactory receptor 7G2 [Sciurus carolinensis]
MKPRNRGMVSEFLLLGLTEDPTLQPLLFSLFLSSMFQMIIVKLEIQDENITFTEMASKSCIVSIIGGLENRPLAVVVWYHYVVICHLQDISEGQVGEEEVHGFVEGEIRADGQDDDEVSQDAEQYMDRKGLKMRG